MTSDHRLAAIAAEDKSSVEPLFDTVIAKLQGEGRSIAGFVQRGACDDSGCRNVTSMEDVETGERITIMQVLGSTSQSCQLDPDRLARVTVLALARLQTRPELAIVNRFGRAEAEGGGMRAVFEKALDLEIPVLTTISQDYRSQWSDYVGDLSYALLPARPDAVLAWCRDALEHAQAR
ncbi:DUF2478 domain-containing protein [Breoghania sp. JC706]|uniref:DUF2478 domain-containing protein n=1 Tax=Breoghania sp. JC706 TaxID=3117732 RepID=UPI003009657D